jgi:hypothetical protein
MDAMLFVCHCGDIPGPSPDVMRVNSQVCALHNHVLIRFLFFLLSVVYCSVKTYLQVRYVNGGINFAKSF